MRDRPLKLMLIDDDPVFRLGLRLWLNQFADLEVVAESDNGVDALTQLATQTGDGSDDSLAQELSLIILDVGLGRSNPALMQGLTLCQEIRQHYPMLPVLVLSSQLEPVVLAVVQQVGATGVCPKNLDAAELGTVVRQLAGAQSPIPLQGIVAPQVTPAPAPPTSPPGWWAIARHNLRISSLRQINTALAAVTEQLRMLDLSLLDRAILAGQRRELRAAQWLVQRLLATPELAEVILQPTVSPPLDAIHRGPIPNQEPGDAGQLVASDRPLSAALASPQSDQLTRDRYLQTLLVETVLAKLQVGISNLTDTPLEIDILRLDRKQELLYLVLRKVEDLLGELRFSQVPPEQLGEKRSLILLDLWAAIATDFFGKYYTVTVTGQNVEVVTLLLQDAAIVQEAILDQIPLVPEVLTHLLVQTPLVVDGTPYPAGNPESLARAEALLDNLLIQLANAVIQPLLNRFATVEVIKQAFYDRRLISNREIEQLRNNLSWRYRLERYVGEPRDIFESQYRLFVLQAGGIRRLAIYAPRSEELAQLSGIPYVVTVTLEARDAIAPRLRSAISVLGSTLVYVLTEVLGRGIGLIGRGILKGIGGAWQDSRYGRNGK